MPQTTPDRTRKPRTDAVRNRDHILEVAEQHFAEHGVSGSLDGVAKRAGVGPGTLYRHFPTREALLAALLSGRAERLLRRMEEIRVGATDAGDALQQWLSALVDWAGEFDGLPEPLRLAVSEEVSPLKVTCDNYIKLTDEFLQAAQAEGSARSDVRGRELFLMALATSWVRGATMADGSSPAAMVALGRSGWSLPATGAEPGA